MKRLLTSAALFLCSLLTFAQFSGSGSGTESDPYLILNPIQLNQLRNFLNKSGVYFKLMADIELSSYLNINSRTITIDLNGKTLSRNHIRALDKQKQYFLRGAFWLLCFCYNKKTCH